MFFLLVVVVAVLLEVRLLRKNKNVYDKSSNGMLGVELFRVFAWSNYKCR